MTNGPRRLNKSGGISQRLLDSASLDKPSHTSRRMAANLASTASAFASSRPANAAPVRPPSTVRTLATWITVGAAASVALGFVGGTLLEPAPAPRAEAPLLSAPPSAPRAAAGPSDISAEPAAPANAAPQVAPAPAVPPGAATKHIEPWVPSPVAIAPDVAPAPGTPKPSVASFDEVREIEAARAAVSRGDATGAIAQLNDYDSSHPNGTLKPEAMALRIQVLSNSGKAAEARTLANEFQGKYPQHPLVQRVRGGVSR